ncbi:MAG: helix-turn-helix transcriptional regulator [Spirochaetes bacterium]|nr:helix-turn-helix transcriptional regulator [Spirochaetota bacterium]
MIHVVFLGYIVSSGLGIAAMILFVLAWKRTGLQGLFYYLFLMAALMLIFLADGASTYATLLFQGGTAQAAIHAFRLYGNMLAKTVFVYVLVRSCSTLASIPLSRKAHAGSIAASLIYGGFSAFGLLRGGRSFIDISYYIMFIMVIGGILFAWRSAGAAHPGMRRFLGMQAVFNCIAVAACFLYAGLAYTLPSFSALSKYPVVMIGYYIAWNVINLIAVGQQLFNAPLMADTGARSPAPSVADIMRRYEISEREMEIIRMIISGSSATVIAASLSISPHTVRNHIKRIYRKTGTGDRINLSRIFFGAEDAASSTQEKLSDR